MTVIYPIAAPYEHARSIELGMSDLVCESRSPFTGVSQFLDYEVGLWNLTINIAPVGRQSGGQEWFAFLVKLAGRRGTFQCPIPNHLEPLGLAKDEPGIPRVKGANQEGSYIDIDGLPANVRGYLREGDLIQIGTRLYAATRRCDSGSDGSARLHVWPNTFGEHPDNAPLIVSGAMGLFRLKDNYRSFSIETFNKYGVTLEAEEAR